MPRHERLTQESVTDEGNRASGRSIDPGIPVNRLVEAGGKLLKLSDTLRRTHTSLVRIGQLIRRRSCLTFSCRLASLF